MNIIFVKFGTKYNADHVNALHDQLKIFLDGKYYCYTDNPNGVGIECVVPIKKPTLNGVWNKLAILSDEMPWNGDCVLFDLDSKVNFDPSPFLEWNDILTILNDYSKKDFTWKKHAYDTRYNSSIMSWKSGTTDHIWKHFLSNHDYFRRKYAGIDRFIWNEKIKVNNFKDGIYNSIANPYHNPCPIDTWDNLEFKI